MDCEIAAINISVNDQTVTVAQKPQDDNLPAFAWHRDSYPFVCVTMLSDCAEMTGGETALKTATGEIMKVRGPAMVCLFPKQSIYTFADVVREPLLSCKDGISNTKH